VAVWLDCLGADAAPDPPDPESPLREPWAEMPELTAVAVAGAPPDEPREPWVWMPCFRYVAGPLGAAPDPPLLIARREALRCVMSSPKFGTNR
jgi:hypothetical protein